MHLQKLLCHNCNHEWQALIEFDPITKSSDFLDDNSAQCPLCNHEATISHDCYVCFEEGKNATE